VRASMPNLGDLRHHHLRMWAPFSSTPLKINCESPITPVACYVRVSTVGQNEAGQRTEIRNWLKGNGIDPERVEWYIDKKSGDNLDRPAFKDLQKNIFAGSVSDDIPNRVLSHYRDERQVVLYATSEAGTCKWCCLDFDNHDELPGVAQRNMDVATGLLNILTELGIVSILEDSDGQGGLHLWVLFAEPIPSEQAYRFVRWLVADYPDDDIETNPKQRHGGKIGNGVRIPGRHHKRDHNSRCWGDAAWLDTDESVDLLLCTVPNDPSVVELMGSFDPDPKPKPTDGYKPEFTTTHTGDNDITRAESHIETTATWPELLTSGASCP